MRASSLQLQERPTKWEKALLRSLQEVREGKGKEPFHVPSLWPSQGEIIAKAEELERAGHPSLGQLIKTLSSASLLFDHFAVLERDLLSPPNNAPELALIDEKGDYKIIRPSIYPHLLKGGEDPTTTYYLKGFSLLPLEGLHAYRLYTLFPAILEKDEWVRRYKALSRSFTHFMKTLQRVELYLLLRRELGELSQEGEEALHSLPSLKWEAAHRFVRMLKEGTEEDRNPLPEWRAARFLFSYYGLLFLRVGGRWKIKGPIEELFPDERELPKSLCLCRELPNIPISYSKEHLHFSFPPQVFEERVALLDTL